MFDSKRSVVVLLILIIAGGLTAGVAPAGASSHYDFVVDDGGTCPGATHSTIGGAVSAAASSGGTETILVCTGTYQESVTVDTPVNIVAANDSDGSGRPVLVGDYNKVVAIDVQADGVTIDGLNITQYGSSTSGGIGVVVGNQQDVTINGTAVNDTTAVGVAVAGGASNVEVTNSAFSNVSMGTHVANASGVTIETVGINDTNRGIVIAPGQGPPTLLAKNIAVQDVAINNSSAIGIDLTAGTGGEIHDVSIRNVSVNHSGVDGIQLESTQDDGVMENVTVENALLAHNPVGLRADIDSTHANPFVDVDVRRTLFDVSGSETAVVVNHENNTEYDLSIRETVVEGNPSSSSDAALLLTPSTNAAHLDYRINIMRDVAVGVENLNASSVLNARQNYWGANNGPSGGLVDPVTEVSADGDGASLESPGGANNIIFDPWLGKSVCDGANGQLFDVAGQTFDFPKVEGVATDQMLSVCVWNRAAFPLRTSDETARTTIPLPSTQFAAADTNLVSLNKRTIPIYQVEDPITVNFSDSQGADTDLFANSEGQVLILRTNGDISLEASGIKAAAFDNGTLTAEFESDGFTVEEVRNVSIDENGIVEFSHRPGQSEQYVYVLVRKKFGDGMAVTNDGNVTVNGGVDVVGVEVALVQAEEASVTKAPSTVEAGENVTLDVNSKLGSGGRTNHTVLLYNETTVKEQRVDILFDEDADQILSASESNFTVETTIDEVTGVFILQDDFDLGDVTILSESVSGTIELSDLFDTSSFTTVSPATTLNASATVRPDAGKSTTVDVGTFENFTAGEYEFVYIAQKGDKLSTTEGTVTIESPSEPDSGPPGGGTPGSGTPGGGTPGGGVGPVQPPSEAVEINVTRDGRVTHVRIKNLKSGRTVTINTSDNTEFDRLGFDLERVQFTSNVDGEVEFTVRRQTHPSSAAAPLDSDRTAFGYVILEHGRPDSAFSNVRLTFRVNQQLARQAGLLPTNISAFRYSDGQYDRLSRTRLTSSSQIYRFRAGSPGLSVFALGSSAANIEVQRASLSRSEITAGESIDVTARVRNEGGTDGTKTVELTVAGEVVETREVDVPAGETTRVTFSRTFDVPGTYEISVNGLSAGSLTVEESETETVTERPPTTVTPDTESPSPESPSDEGEADVLLIGIVLVILIVLLVVSTLAYQRYQNQL